MTRTVVVKNLSTVVPDAEVRHMIPALQKQLTRDFAPIYGGGGHLLFAHVETEPAADAALLYLYDDADQAGALGYHDLGAQGQPLAKVFAKTTLADGGLVSVTTSHELLEMCADPNVNLMAMDEEHGRFYCFEVCDSPESDDFGYEINGVRVSDFVLPSWFEPTHVTKGEKFAFKSPLTVPFQLMPGGYIAFYELRSKSWQQATARKHVNARELHEELVHDHGSVARLASVRALGHRRQKRLKPRTEWKRSTGL